MSEILNSLNDQQQQAVQHPAGPALVLAGAGSGKTRVLTTRAAWLLSTGKVRPESLLLVTFTNKAANEINRRIFALTGARLPLSGTFHSLCARFLRRDGHLVGLDSNYTIYDSDDQLALVKQLYKKHGFSTKEYNPKSVKHTISSVKNELLSPSNYETMATGHFQEFVARVYHLYQQALSDNNAVDFDDLLLKMVQLLRSSKTILGKYQNQIRHVLVDEYQDTNKAQYELTKLLARPQNNVFVVGDFAQSIYGWRGADYRNMLNLKRDFPDITEYRLEQNYRSTQTILDAATQIISQTTEHPVLKLWTKQPHQQKLVCFETGTDQEEAHKVLEEVTTSLRDYDYNDVAILYRTNAQSRSFEEVCVKLGIPYRLIGGFKFYERKEIKDLLAYLHLFLNPKDSVALDRATKIGKRRLGSFEKWRLNYLKQNPDNNHNPGQVLSQIIDATTYKDKYDPEDPEDLSRLENIQELLNVASQFDNMVSFLENVALVQDDYLLDLDPQDSGQALTLMSLHSAKGLEYPVVFMVGMEDGVLPHSRSLFDKSQLEEERRLCYVGITRAKERLYFTFARKRWQHGRNSYGIQSRFLEDIPQELVKIYATSSAANHAQPNQNSFLSQMKKPKTQTQRRVVVDDDTLDALLSGELDVDRFLDD